VTAKEYLEQIEQIESIIVNRLLERKRWVNIADGLGGASDGDKVQSSKNLQPMQTAVLNYIEIDEEIAYLRHKREEIIKDIESLPRKEYNVIYKLYVDRMTMKEVAYHFCRSYDWVKLKKRSAMGRIQAMLDEKRG
jgi:DNA-directed RNA polymerase specialized sigma24 family protein